MIDTQYAETCIKKLESIFLLLRKHSVKAQVQDTLYEVYRSAVIKEYEILLEHIGHLLKKYLRSFFHTNRAIDTLTFKDIFRYAGKHGLLNIEEVQRWLQYRDNRNETAHNYGVQLANNTIPLIEQFLVDAKQIVRSIQKENAITRER